MGWALVLGQVRKMVKWSFTLDVGQVIRFLTMGRDPIINWILFDDVSAEIFRISRPRFYLRDSAA